MEVNYLQTTTERLEIKGNPTTGISHKPKASVAATSQSHVTNASVARSNVMVKLRVNDAELSNCNAFTRQIAAVVVSEIPSKLSTSVNRTSPTDRSAREFRSMNASIQSLQEQVENLYAHIDALRGGHEQNGALHHDSSQYPIHPSLEHASHQGAFPRLKSPSQARERNSQFQGPTSSAYSFDVANSSLQTMGITQAGSNDDNAELFNENPSSQTYPNQAPTAPMTMHPDKEPLWSISKEEAVRLCRIYQEEMGTMYPIINIEQIIHRANFLFKFTESAARTGLIRADLPGRDSLGTDDNNILKMILATALTVEGNGHNELGAWLFQSVKDALEGRLWEPVELKGLTLLVIVAQYYFHMDEEVRAYRIIGLAARLSLEMGLHRRDFLAKSLMGEEERSQATRLFWSIYVLDRRWSFGTGMPFAIQDSDIDPALPEPNDGTPYLTVMIPYSRISAKVWYAVNASNGAGKIIDQETIGYLDFEILQWQRSLPDALHYNGSYDDVTTGGFPKSQRRLQILLHLRANQMRIFLYRPVLLSATSTMNNRRLAQTAVDIARETIRALTLLNRRSDIYRTQQVCFNYFIVSAVGVIFLAISHAPIEFSSQVRDEFYMALDLIEGFSTKSYVSERLWKTIRGLKEIGPKLGLVSRQALPDEDDPTSSAAVAMAGLAGHQVDERSVFNPAQGPSPLGNVPLDGQQMSLELKNIFEAAGGYCLTNLQAPDSMSGLANARVDGVNQGISGLYDSPEDFSRIMRDLF